MSESERPSRIVVGTARHTSATAGASQADLVTGAAYALAGGGRPHRGNAATSAESSHQSSSSTTVASSGNSMWGKLARSAGSSSVAVPAGSGTEARYMSRPIGSVLVRSPMTAPPGVR
jgi:acetylornithine/succinyldiaminopimelate/putrescine aminotransferase